MKTIHLRSEGMLLVGNTNGMTFRASARLDEVDNNPDDVLIVCDDWVHTMTPSFFLGAFEKSVRKFGDSFLSKYRFEGPERVQKDVIEGIRRVTFDRRLARARVRGAKA